ncbi:MAG: ATP-dependent 6-phosphofructokinase [Caldisericia bacterium]|nr:ATP-dependent 6-phosphofructokinase [Caldisericia bacterium]
MRIAILTSGGDAPGMNAAIRAITRTAIFDGNEVIGIKRGFLGLMKGEFISLDSRDVGGILSRGGTLLFTSRAPEFKLETGINDAIKNIKGLGIDYIIIIGGNGSQTGAFELHKRGINTIGIASTIDNDIWGTDQTIGFDTALNNAIQAIDKIRDTATSHERVFVIEVMGRDVGILALHCGISAGADEIIVPEIQYDLEKITENIKMSFERGKKHFIIVLAEGAGRASDFGKKLFDTAKIDAKISVLGYIQRGGDPTFIDRFLATQFGAFAVKCAEDGVKGKIVGIKNNNLTLINMEEAAGKVKKIDPMLYNLSQKLSI